MGRMFANGPGTHSALRTSQIPQSAAHQQKDVDPIRCTMKPSPHPPFAYLPTNLTAGSAQPADILHERIERRMDCGRGAAFFLRSWNKASCLRKNRFSAASAVRLRKPVPQKLVQSETTICNVTLSFESCRKMLSTWQSSHSYSLIRLHDHVFADHRCFRHSCSSWGCRYRWLSNNGSRRAPPWDSSGGTLSCERSAYQK